MNNDMVFTRREIMAGSAAKAVGSLFVGAPKVKHAAEIPVGVSIAEPYEYLSQGPVETEMRLAEIMRLGFHYTRIGLPWNAFELSEGNWSLPSSSHYLKSCQKTSLRNRLILSALAWPPKWFQERYSDPFLRDDGNLVCGRLLSYWLPGIAEIMSNAFYGMLKTLVIAGYTESISTIIVEAGAAGEVAYPARGYVVGEREPKFWAYDSHARSSYQSYLSDRFHANIGLANLAMGTSLRSFTEAYVPQKSNCSPQTFSVFIDWYRKTLLDFLFQQISSYHSVLEQLGLVKQIKLLVLIPGSHIRRNDTLGSSMCHNSERLRLMLDNDASMLIAARNNCYLQNTGGDDLAELSYQVSLMKNRKINVPFWCETAHFDRWDAMVTQAIEVGCAGIEFVDSRLLGSKGDRLPQGSQFEATIKKFNNHAIDR